MVCLILSHCLHFFKFEYLVPSQSPVDIASAILSSSSVSLSWNPPPSHSQNGIIISYHLNITSLINGHSIFLLSNGTTIQIDGLTPYTRYSCLVAAQTNVGRGPYTTSISFTTKEDG